MPSCTNIKMAAYYPYIIVALPIIYSHTTDAKSTCISDTAVIRRHLLDEEKLPKSFALAPDAVCSLTAKEKQGLCDEVTRHLIINKLGSISGKSTLAEPRIAKKYTAFLPREVRVEGLKIPKLMYWCLPKEYKRKVTGVDMLSPKTPKSNVGQIQGFFCAGSPTRGDTVYVFRPKVPDAEEVAPIVELNNWSLRDGSSSSSSSSEINIDDSDEIESDGSDVVDERISFVA